MSEHRFEFDQEFLPDRRTSDNLDHYRIQIDKLQRKLEQSSLAYEQRIAALEGELQHQRKPIFQEPLETSRTKAAPTLNYDLFTRDQQIAQLKQENGALRQAVNNPDHTLLKRNSQIEAIAERDNEIAKLRKTLHELEGRYDGKFFPKHRTAKELEMVVQENQQLRTHIRALEQRAKPKEEESSEALDNLRLKKELDAATQENRLLRKALSKSEYELKDKASQPSLLRSQRGAVGLNTQLEDAKIELEEYKGKLREMKKELEATKKENTELVGQRESRRGRVSQISGRDKDDDDKIRRLRHQENLRESMREGDRGGPTTVRKSARYAQYNFAQLTGSSGVKT